MGKGMSGHQSTKNETNTWLTPPSILKSLGEFDLDPCAAIGQPWPTAKVHFTEKENGLIMPWKNIDHHTHITNSEWETIPCISVIKNPRVWLNPPYSTALIIQFMKKMAEHNNGIALVFARTETKFFQQYVFPVCSSILFFDKRIAFYSVNGQQAKSSGGAPSVLIGYGDHNSQAISDSGLPGKHIPVNTIPIVIVGVSPTWTSVTTIAINRNGGEADLQTLYDIIETIAPDKCQQNPHYKAKIRQVMQSNFERVARGRYTNQKNNYENLHD